MKLLRRELIDALNSDDAYGPNQVLWPAPRFWNWVLNPWYAMKRKVYEEAAEKYFNLGYNLGYVKTKNFEDETAEELLGTLMNFVKENNKHFAKYKPRKRKTNGKDEI